MIPQPVRYRWDVYGSDPEPTPWRVYTPGKFNRALRACTMSRERLRIEFDNGQHVIVRPKWMRKS